MNKQIYINLEYKEGVAKSHIFYPTKKHACINYKSSSKVEGYKQVLLCCFEFIKSLNINLPVILLSDEVIITNILNEKKDTNKNWEQVIKNISGCCAQLKAYTSV
jgi:hypothetical protein